MSPPRAATVSRKTGETDVTVTVGFDGPGRAAVSTGVPFLDHMLHLFAKHGRVDLEVTARGDTEVDFHHTVEDTGIVLGQATREALGEKRGIFRYGSALLPMDETLARVAVDFSGRPYLEFRAPSGVDSIGGNFPFTLVEEFMRAFAFNAAINLHAEILYGRDGHHMAEALFKGLARAVDEATRIDPRLAGDVPSTKGAL